ncbi:uncharacterized protein N7482_002292 [Penicillium canariense]|uniref:Uncharacterized protein n=1 Tax=Penicillium canariense TaxID=189055 RepID=A0A9W9IFR5_9EURO|nr:uncharacterized protein N7482_002292 [Penicillium canariense]KAJ5176415.1 hypothetical protein N7482_002292 [Penicillium canariense]
MSFTHIFHHSISSRTPHLTPISSRSSCTMSLRKRDDPGESQEPRTDILYSANEGEDWRGRQKLRASRTAVDAN